MCESFAVITSRRAFARDADEEGLAILTFRLRIEAEAGIGIAEESVGVGALGRGIHEGAESGQEGVELVVIRSRRYQRSPRVRECCVVRTPGALWAG